MSRLRAPSLARLAVGTTALTFVLVLLGIWTAVAGYGLTCAGRWPFCDGAVFGLFPATFGSFVEWFHRLVAMVTGFAILATAVLAWVRRAPAGVRAAFALALALTPVQVVLGALTVTRYELLILATHFGAALAILSLLVAGTVWLAERPPDTGRLGLGAVLVLPLALALTPGLFVAAHSTPLHIAYYAFGLGGYVALLAGAVSATGSLDAPRSLAAAGALATAVALVVGRVRVDATGQLVVLGALVLAVVLAGAVAWVAHAGGRPVRSVDRARE